MGTESTVQPPTSPSQANTRQCDSKAKQGVLSFNVGILLSTTSDSVFRVSLVSSMVKNLPPVQETWVQSLGWEDFLEKGMATHSRILAWRIPWTEEPGKGCKESDSTKGLTVLLLRIQYI